MKITIVLLFLPALALAVPAFCGAEGGGAVSEGGRGGKVIEVTNLNDDGSGSLRAAIEASGARTIVFKVAGIIEVKSPLRIKNSHVTIAGQTAPGQGILINGIKMDSTPVMIYTNDVIIRFISVRMGKGGQVDQYGDCISIEKNGYNVIIDHCSASWSNDETLCAWAKTPIHNVTFSWNFIAEALTYSHIGCGCIVGTDGDETDMTDFSIHHNLFMDNQKRNPIVKCHDAEIINNIMFNYTWWATAFGDGMDVDIIGNLYRKGPSTGNDLEILHRVGEGLPGTPSIYIRGNKGPHQENPDQDNWSMVNIAIAESSCRRFTPMSPKQYPVTVHQVSQIEDLLLADAGACRRLDENGNWVGKRDAVDLRLVNEYHSGTGVIPIDENSVGGFPQIDPGTPYTDSDSDGMPDAWENSHGFDLGDPDDGAEDADSDGYTNLEEFLNGTDPENPVNSTGNFTSYATSTSTSGSNASSGNGMKSPCSAQAAGLLLYVSIVLFGRKRQ